MKTFLTLLILGWFQGTKAVWYLFDEATGKLVHGPDILEIPRMPNKVTTALRVVVSGKEKEQGRFVGDTVAFSHDGDNLIVKTTINVSLHIPNISTQFPLQCNEADWNYQAAELYVRPFTEDKYGTYIEMELSPYSGRYLTIVDNKNCNRR